MSEPLISRELSRQLVELRYRATPSIVALFEKPAPGIHARRDKVRIGPNGFAGDHAKKSWWRGREVPGRDVTVMAAEVLARLEVAHDVPGDNLITRGVDLKSLEPGDRMVAGTVVLRRSVKDHRPCDVFARRTSQSVMRAVAGTNTRGALFVVEKEGHVQVGDPIRIERTHACSSSSH